MRREKVAQTACFSRVGGVSRFVGDSQHPRGVGVFFRARRRACKGTPVAADVNFELRKLLDQYDEKRRAVEKRRQQVKTDEDNFLKGFAALRTNVVKPVFEAIGVILKERGHGFNISEDEYAGEPGGNTTEAAVSIRIVPAGMEKAQHDDPQFPSLSFVTRHYNKTVCVHSSNAVPQSGGPASPRGDYQLAQIDEDLVEAELLKLIAGMVSR
jgi:hypothetical protein